MSETARQLSWLDQVRADEIALADRLEYERYATAATRREAKELIEPSVANYREQVLRYIRGHGPCCDERISDGLKMNPSTQRPRRIELERAGRIVASGTQVTRSGRKAISWVVSEFDD